MKIFPPFSKWKKKLLVEVQSEDSPFYVDTGGTLGQHNLNNILEQWGRPLKLLRISEVN